ncbi:hypothetical protein [Planctomicrobium sp. SH527]|uniref:hypothetical protein n=1 Tax=Planctomicrobium sp. SH527 TaxID=3448123 RepID=UPI003F5B347C
MRLHSLCVALTLCVLTIGCGRSDIVPTTVVEGTVTFDGTPVEMGEIRLSPVDINQSGTAAKIENGRFRAESPLGQMKVLITAYRETKGKVVELNPGEKSAPVEQFIPTKFNEKTELQIDVKKGTQPVTFDLSSK